METASEERGFVTLKMLHDYSRQNSSFKTSFI
jgi:hypothetical protein